MRFLIMQRGFTQRAVRAAAAFALAAIAATGGSSVATATAVAPVAGLHVPPPSPAEAMPPLPRGGAFTWLPGHWCWTGIGGAEWQWERGRYVAWPASPTRSAADPVPLTPRIGSEDDWR